jgi:hypothetical protein
MRENMEKTAQTNSSFFIAKTPLNWRPEAAEFVWPNFLGLAGVSAANGFQQATSNPSVLPTIAHGLQKEDEERSTFVVRR